MDTLDYSNIAIGVRNAIYDMRNWPEQNTVKTVVGRVLDRLIEQFKMHDKDFSSKLFVDEIYGEDKNIPF